MNDPLISVIVPVYKAQAYLEECVDSILSQTYSNLEVILVDDGSPDDCPDICDAYARKYPRVSVIHQKNRGVSAARNAGMDAATGEYIAFVDADDRLAPEMYQTLYSLLRREGASFAVCNLYLWHESGARENPLSENCPREGCVPAREAYPYLFARGSYECYSCNKLFERGLFEGEGALRFDEGITVCEDRLFIAQVLPRAKAVAFTSFPGYYYRIREKDAFNKRGEKGHASNLAARKQVLECIPEEYASYDKAIYLCLLAHCTCDAYESGDKPRRREMKKELRKISKEYTPDFLANGSYFDFTRHLLILMIRMNCSLACGLYSLLRKAR